MYFMYNVLIVFIDLHQNNKTIFLNHTTEYGFQRTLKKKKIDILVYFKQIRNIDYFDRYFLRLTSFNSKPSHCKPPNRNTGKKRKKEMALNFKTFWRKKSR